jgi:hypothetical protein
MKRKAFWIALLACVNVALLAAIVLVTWQPRQALAQGMGLNGNYLMVTGQIQQGYDALYVIDTRQRTLHAWDYEKGRNTLIYRDMRDLEADFRNNR